MLRLLHLRDIVLVDEAEIEFGPGFNVLSGETGAGKSILLDALLLALGHRADAQLVRDGCARAEVVAEFAVDSALDGWLSERELGGDPGTVLLRRVVDADGRSRGFVNGRPAPASMLREIAERLLDVHGQHAHQRLMSSAAQRDLLDGYAALQPRVAEVATAWRDWRAAEDALARARDEGDQLAAERERLSWQVDELAALELRDDEWAALETEQKRLANAASLIDGARAAAATLQEADEALAPALARLAARLRPLAAIDAALAPALELLDGASIQADEAASALSAYADRIDLDPARLDEVDRRLGAVHAAARKFRLAPEAIPAELARLQERLASLARAADIGALQASADRLRTIYDGLARALGEARRAAAGRLAGEVAAGIAGLGMAGGTFEIAVEAADPGAAGSDRVEFLVAGHAGSTPRSIAKIASGGELSRVGLAIAVAAATVQPVGTLVFDEADSGVGGAVAELIGRLMRRLGDARQVLCVTHLPQVAAQAHRHFQVSKRERDGRTVSAVRRLDERERVEEVARMLGGVEITATTRRHARELLAP